MSVNSNGYIHLGGSIRNIYILLLLSLSYSASLLVPEEYSTIQSAIDAAVEGDSVLVSAGTYYENIIWPATNGIKLIGSGEDDCIIDGNASASVIRFEGGGIIDSTTLITGFTIQNGYAQGGSPYYSGGGMNLYESSPTLTGVTFSDNTAYFRGGGMYLLESSATLTDITFSGNTAVYGGGMCLYVSSPTLTGVTFSGNTAGHGGGMTLGNSSNPTLTDVAFSGNTAGSGGGMAIWDSSPILTGVIFSNNSSGNDGGGMTLSYSSPTLTGVIFSGNTAASHGGGMNLVNSSPILTDVAFSGNTTSYSGGGMYLRESSPILTDVTFSGNSTLGSGGGMYLLDICNPTLTSVTFSNNTANNYGGGMVLYFSSPTLTNSILWGNSPQEIYFREDGNPNSITITYSVIQGGEAGIVTNDNGAVYWGEGNIDADPLFCDAENGDLTVHSYSPVLGSGLDGTDMGAYGVGCGPLIYGCTDPYASNYDPDVTVDDGSCEYEPYFETIWDEMNTTIMAIYIESAELEGVPLDNGDEIGIFDGDACVGVARLDSPIDETYQIFVPADNSSTSEIDGYIAGNPIAFLYWDVSSQTVYSDIDITIISGSSTYQDFANTAVELSYDTIYGCMDIEACNYSPDANTDDGSCEYPDDHHDCDGNCLVELDCTGNCCVIGEEGCYWQETGPCGEEEPSNGMDSCGVCGGDNSSCLDCAGEPCSDAYMDNCGVCDDIPENDCVQDCAETWGGTAEEDECGVCGGDGAIYECGCEDIADGECDCGVLQELGDMNCDYLLNVLDVVALVQEVLNDNGYYIYADINEDGFVNILDVVILVNWIINGVPVCEGVEDIDGNCYETIQIGVQVWMAENLKVTHYRDGSYISSGHTDEEWTQLETGAYAVYDDDPSNADTYGNLYNWYAVDDSRGLCMDGWHVPSDEEWTILTDFIAPEGIESWGNSIAGGEMKSTGTIEDGDGLWYSPNAGATNESGFTGLPAGHRYYYYGSYNAMGFGGYFWSSSENSSDGVWYRYLYSSVSDVYRSNSSKLRGFSIRCLGD